MQITKFYCRMQVIENGIRDVFGYLLHFALEYKTLIYLLHFAKYIIHQTRNYLCNSSSLHAVMNVLLTIKTRSNMIIDVVTVTMGISLINWHFISYDILNSTSPNIYFKIYKDPLILISDISIKPSRYRAWRKGPNTESGALSHISAFE